MKIFSYFGICPIFGGRFRTEEVFSAPEIEPETKNEIHLLKDNIQTYSIPLMFLAKDH